jgi:hypothetical protein
MFFYSKEAQVGKFQDEKLANVENFTWNLSHSIVICHKTKPLQETLKHLEKKKIAQISNLNVEILQQLKELSSTHFFKL